MNDATTGFTEVTFERSEWASAWIPLGVDLDSDARLEQALAWFDEHADELRWDHDGSEVEATGANIGPIEPTRGARPFSPCLGGAADREVAIIVDELDRALGWHGGNGAACFTGSLHDAIDGRDTRKRARCIMDQDDIRFRRHDSQAVGNRILAFRTPGYHLKWLESRNMAQQPADGRYILLRNDDNQIVNLR